MPIEEVTPLQLPQVFISYQKYDVHNGFFSHLECALKRDGINVYDYDDQGLRRSINLLLKGIEKSRIALVIFSSRYTKSKWCLDQLVKITELVEEGKIVAIPVFFNVDPFDVKRLEGEFGDNLRNLVSRDFEKFKKWKEALDFVSQSPGFVFHDRSDNEAEVINSIAVEVKAVIAGILLGQKEKSHDYRLSELQEDASLDTQTDKNPKEAEIFQAKAKSRRDDGLNLSKYEDRIFAKTYTSTPLLDEGGAIDRIVENVPKGLECIPAERTENPRDKDTEFATGKFGAKCKKSSSQDIEKLVVEDARHVGRDNEYPMDMFPRRQSGKYGAKPSEVQVFINFHGDELFIGHLVDALERSGINVFMDTKVNIGDDLNNLFKRIEDSGIAIVVFSSRYPESELCLNELVKIKERAHQGLLKVVPIFCKVTPGNVKRLEGDFGKNFRDTENKYASDERKIKRWKEAFAFVSHKFALTFDEERNEFESINSIVEQVKMLVTWISPKQIEKSHDCLNELQKDASADSSRSEDLEGVDGERGGILWDTNSDRNPQEAEIVHPDGKSRRDDGLNLSKDDNFLGEANSHSTVVELPPNHQMSRHGFPSPLVKSLESYKITRQLGIIIIGCLLLPFLCLQHIAYMSTTLVGEGSAIDKIVENMPKVLKYIPADRSENPRDKFTEFPTAKFGANPESSSDAKTNADLLERTCYCSPMDGKVKPPKIQVFINFRGDQLRNNFVGYLVDALQRSEINVFIDTEADIGDNLNDLLKRIEDSGIAIVVFSSRYTESEWCLNELVKIKERSLQGQLKVFPIFFKVTPENVKKLKGEFGDNFRDKEYMYASDEPKIKRWKEAIEFVSNKFALTFDEKRSSSVSEIDFIKTIVEKVLKMLQDISTVESGQSSR